MSDLGRKSLSEQMEEKVIPNSEKSYGKQATENLTGTYDKAASALQPDGEKSTSQKMGDTIRSGADGAQTDGAGLVSSAQKTVGNAFSVASDKFKAAGDYVAGKPDNTKSV